LVGDTAEHGAVLKDRKILVVDDEEETRILISSILEDNGAKTIQAADGDEAIELARRERPDLMTLDLSMPGKSGVDVFVIVREDPELRDIPICIITREQKG
jgi:CheY-like chemotaxis protein